MTHDRPPDDRPRWLDRRGNVNLLIGLLAVACAAVVAADFLYARQFHFAPPEEARGFYALYGFIAFIVIIFAGKLLRLIVMRDEDYYDR